ncbi:DNA-binding protein [Mesorhizobium sp. M6A.T.Cr.TU.014.01.1.1]|uniref:ParB/RepB/Spo0J family partition protein n=1 Tax=Mesorhizobium sp. M6A.T.Cr.TU.014.01.1.1 TaxID=2496676 RepID=UPI000FD4E953|nr:ParB/RepB/Spo0J family partition protein [Mesorhizobium sp. M6A.T.Cr.TU.014.01.1.1]RVB80643.1 DNA-binding protein [Mesorhizobium sp. M6A.T.Cr.TU.014.01.1.1]
MATAVQKITLSSSRDIPFNKLVLSQSNIRRVKAGVSIEDLASSIARRGLIQSLSVQPVFDADGNETGMFEVPAGGRRFRALELLVKSKRLAKTAPVPCIVRDRESDILAEEVSLAENIERAPLHPLDQFRSFQDMLVKGMTEEEIAAAFFLPVNVVKQRLRLASVSPALLDVYADDGMTLEQLMAFTVSGDHDRQAQVWNAIKDAWSKEPYQIRRMLTETTVRASDKRAVFLGVEAYVAAGGIVMHDLFQSDDGGWLQDAALLDRLVAEKLKADAEAIAAEGWKWIEVAVSFPFDAMRGLREVSGTPLDLTAEEQATIEALNAEYAKLEAAYEDADELPDEVDLRLGEIETALANFDERPVQFDAADIAIAGVFISINADGSLSVNRGFVRPEDVPAVSVDGADGSEIDDGGSVDPGNPTVQRAVVTIGGQMVGSEEDEDNAIKPLPDRLVTELTAHQTLALRDALAGNPHVAMTALLHKLVTDTFQHHSTTGCLEASVRHIFLPVQPDELKNSPSATSAVQRHEAWKSVLPASDDGLWDWIAALDDNSRAALLAHCVSFGVNALYEKADRYGGGAVSAHGVQQRIAQAHRLARAVGLDMVKAGWAPTVGNYLGRVTKSRILEAVREAKGEQASQLIDHLKKDDMAKEAERLLADTGWLPEPLRLADLDGGSAGMDSASAAEGDEDSLPEFLTGEVEDSEPHMVVAE